VGVSVAAEPWHYPTDPPFAPDQAYAELGGRVRPGKARNIVYPAFHALAHALGLDASHRGTAGWNPLGDWIRPGQNVLIKPNLVRHVHLAGGDYQAVVTHASLVRCVLDYVALALGGRGQVTVGDAPVQSADFEAILARTGLREVCEDVAKTWDIPVRPVDFRLWSVELDGQHRVVRGSARSGDPAGCRWVDLGTRSLLHDIAADCDRFRVTCYDPGAMTRHHNLQTHQYIVAQSVLDADVVLNLPKLKTHRKVGLTAALKNVVGINGHKDCLPHHRCGSTAEGGDEYLHPSRLKRAQTRWGEAMDRAPASRANGLRRFLGRAADRLGRWLNVDPYLEGSWYGNDTLWRTVLDLNRVLLYADREGRIAEVPQRRSFTIVDAIVAGEGEGPMEPDPRPCGLLVGGANPVAVDAALATLIGFDFRRLPLIARAFELEDLPLVAFSHEQVQVVDVDGRFADTRVGAPCDHYRFKPPSGWSGRVELASTGAAGSMRAPIRSS